MIPLIPLSALLAFTPGIRLGRAVVSASGKGIILIPLPFVPLSRDRVAYGKGIKGIILRGMGPVIPFGQRSRPWAVRLLPRADAEGALGPLEGDVGYARRSGVLTDLSAFHRAALELVPQELHRLLQGGAFLGVGGGGE